MTLSRTLALTLSLAFAAACGAPATTATVAPTPVPTPVVTTPATEVPAVSLAEAPRAWQLMDETTDHVPGISANRAMTELLAGQTPKQTVLVAIIDGGIDTNQVDLKANLWSNPKEVPGNGQDDDHNGHVDDVRGWDFIGGAKGDVNTDTFVITREYARCHGGAAAGGAPKNTDAKYCASIDSAYNAQKKLIDDELQGYRQVNTVMDQIVPMLKQAIPAETLTLDNVKAYAPTTPTLTRARAIFLQFAGEGASPDQVKSTLDDLENQEQYSLNPDFNPRGIIGDDYLDLKQSTYGNSDVMGPDASHGTHVAGIIGAVRDNGIGVDGIAPAVKLMMIRTIPNGDERDKDVANAIRYATDMGAKIISMSFGKPYSPYKADVDDAVKYADAHGVLMVHASGNDGKDLAVGHNYPNQFYLGGGRAQDWIEVGASSWKGGQDLPASFSNYGKQQVDVFAPGVDILSTVPGNKYERDSGTSMAAPVVSGLAALIMDYFPNLSAADVKRIIMASVTRVDQDVTQPHPDDVTQSTQVPFSSLSVSGGIVNAYNAIKMAQQESRSK